MSRVIAFIHSWAYQPREDGRDLRLDLLRGFAVLAMVVDHIGGESWITLITGYDQFLVSAAEGFVFISGFLMGLVYGHRIERRGWVSTAEAILHRAILLYLVTVALTLLFVGLFLFTDLRLWLDRSYGLGLTDPVELVVGTLTLHYTYHGTDILWMYAVLIAASPLLFHLLITGRTLQLLLGSTALWLAYQFFPTQATIPWVVDNAVYFPVAAWQVLFVAGLAMGYHRESIARRVGRLTGWPTFIVFAAIFVGLIMLDTAHERGRLASWPGFGWLAGERWDMVFNKPSVSWGRLAAFALTAPFFYLLVTQLWGPIYRAFGGLLMPLGSSALVAYASHLIVIVAVYNLAGAFVGTDNRWVNSIGQLLGLGLVWLIVVSWRRVAELEERVQRWWSDRIHLEGVRRWQALGAASVLVVGLAMLTTVLVGPIRASRPAETATEASPAGTLLYVPDLVEGRALTALIVLPDARGTGPRAAARLVEEARAANWALIAPTLESSVWEAPEDASAAASTTLPELARLVTQLGDRLGLPGEPRVLLLGRGTGAQLAYQFALLYPELVRGVALADSIPCTLPVGQSFPLGIADAPLYRPDYPGPAAYRGLALALVAAVPSADATACEWTGETVSARQQLDRVVAAWRDAGAVVTVSTDAARGPAGAVAALRSALEAATP